MYCVIIKDGEKGVHYYSWAAYPTKMTLRINSQLYSFTIHKTLDVPRLIIDSPGNL